MIGHRPAYWTLWRMMEARALASTTFAPPMLDLGCGDGLFVAGLYPAGIAVGLDVARKDLLEGQKCGHFRSVVQGDGRFVPFADECFRLVFSNCVLEHMPDINTVLKEIARVTQPGGRLIFTVPSDRFSEYLLGSKFVSGYGRFVNRVLSHRNMYDTDSWGAMLRGAGFSLRKVVHFGSRRALRVFDVLLWLAIPGHVLHRTFGIRPFLRTRWWERFLANLAALEGDAGIMIEAERDK